MPKVQTPRYAIRCLSEDYETSPTYPSRASAEQAIRDIEDGMCSGSHSVVEWQPVVRGVWEHPVTRRRYRR
jgi:hypothetical protein